MVHRTYRRLDEPPKLAGFSFTQWVALITLGAGVYGLERVLGVATQPAISLFTFLVGGPAALLHFSESGRPTLLRLARDTARWLTHPHTHTAGPGQPHTIHVRAARPADPAPRQRPRRGQGRGRGPVVRAGR